MANLSFAFGECTIRTTNKNDLINFIYLKQIIEVKAFYAIEFENVPYNSEDEVYLTHHAIEHYLNTNNKIKYDKDIDQHVFKVRILGTGRNTYDYNMEHFFTSVFEHDFKHKKQNEIKGKLKNSDFTATFEITDTSEVEDFIAKGQYTSNWINQTPTFQKNNEDVYSYNAKNARKFNYLDDPWDYEYAMENFEEFTKLLEKKYEETDNEIYKTMLSDKEHLYDELEDTGVSICNDFDEFLEEFEQEFTKK